MTREHVAREREKKKEKKKKRFALLGSYVLLLLD